MGLTEQELKQLEENVRKKSKAPKDLFGNEEQVNVTEEYGKIFQSIIKDKDYIWIPSQIIGKKNNYMAFQRYTGRSICCGAPYDKKSKICTVCGNKTRSGKVTGAIGLNKRAMNYKNDTIKTYRSSKQYFEKRNENNKISIVGVFFVRKDRRRFDMDNMLTMVCDQLTDSGLIPDDSADKFIAIPLGFIVRKEQPGIIIKVINNESFFNFAKSI